MARLSTRSNPTGLKEVDKGRISLAVTEIAGQRYVSLQKLDLKGMDLPDSLQVICVASAGKTRQRFNLGTAAEWSKEGQPLRDLDNSETLRFRILLRDAAAPRLIASAEGIRTKDERQSESLLPMEPAELGQLLWKLEIKEGEGPILKYNATVFPSAAGVENYPPFRALVLPEALRQVLRYIAEDASVLDDDGDWAFAWGEWLDALGSRPSASELDEDKDEWCDRATAAFCERYKFAAHLAYELQRGSSE